MTKTKEELKELKKIWNIKQQIKRANKRRTKVSYYYSISLLFLVWFQGFYIYLILKNSFFCKKSLTLQYIVISLIEKLGFVVAIISNILDYLQMQWLQNTVDYLFLWWTLLLIFFYIK